jgi:hypothetical protein
MATADTTKITFLFGVQSEVEDDRHETGQHRRDHGDPTHRRQLAEDRETWTTRRRSGRDGGHRRILGGRPLQEGDRRGLIG